MPHSNTSNRILISGASMAGLTLAYWLRKHGFQVTIVEKASTVRTGGYAVDLRGPAIEVARRMGILEDIRQATTGIAHLYYVDSHNKIQADGVLASELFSGTGEDRDAEILRGDLAHILYRALDKEVEYIWSDSVTSLQETANGVTVQFESHTERQFALVIGADGLHSQVRQLAFGDEAQFSKFLGYYVGIYTTPNFLNLKHKGYFYPTLNKTAGVYPARDGKEIKAMFYFRSPQLSHARHDAAAQQQAVKDVFGSDTWFIPQMLEYMLQAPDFYFDSLTLIEMERWSQGRTALLGDAAFCATPLSGQGTSLAMVGAYVLAGELKAARGDHRQAFSMYEQEMRPFVEMNQKTAHNNARHFIASTHWQLWVSRVMMKMLPYMPGKKSIIRNFRKPYLAYTLKEY